METELCLIHAASIWILYVCGIPQWWKTVCFIIQAQSTLPEFQADISQLELL